MSRRPNGYPTSTRGQSRALAGNGSNIVRSDGLLPRLPPGGRGARIRTPIGPRIVTVTPTSVPPFIPQVVRRVPHPGIRVIARALQVVASGPAGGVFIPNAGPIELPGFDKMLECLNNQPPGYWRSASGIPGSYDGSPGLSCEPVYTVGPSAPTEEAVPIIDVDPAANDIWGWKVPRPYYNPHAGVWYLADAGGSVWYRRRAGYDGPATVRRGTIVLPGTAPNASPEVQPKPALDLRFDVVPGTLTGDGLAIGDSAAADGRAGPKVNFGRQVGYGTAADPRLSRQNRMNPRNPTPLPAPPKAGEKENKSKARAVMASLAKWAFAVSETNEVVEAAYKSLPKSQQTCRYKDIKCYGAKVYRNHEDVNVDAFVKAMVANVIEDYIIGFADAKVAKALRDHGITVTGDKNVAIRSKEAFQAGGKAVSRASEQVVDAIWNLTGLD